MFKKTKITSKRLLWPDAIRAISIFLVILIHVSAPVVLSWGKIPTSRWMAGNIFDSLARIAVPLFVILSGSLILHKKEKLASFIKKRFSRIFLPWFFWGTVLLFFNNYFGFATFGDKNFKLLLIENFLGGFWFMPMLVGIYLVTPIIKPFVQRAKDIEFIYFFSLWFIIASVIPTLSNLFELSVSINIPIWASYLGYYVGGYFIVHRLKFLKRPNLSKYLKDKSKFKYWKDKTNFKYFKTNKKIFSFKLWMLTLFIFSFLITIIGTYNLTTDRNQFTDYFYNYISVPVVTMSFSGFILIKNYFEKININKITTKIIRFFSNQSFDIFLSHILILRLFENGALGFKFSSLSFNPIFSIPILTIIVVITSGFLSLLTKSVIPTLKYIFNKI